MSISFSSSLCLTRAHSETTHSTNTDRDNITKIMCIAPYLYMYIALSHYRNNLFVEQIAYIIQVHFTLSYRPTRRRVHMFVYTPHSKYMRR